MDLQRHGGAKLRRAMAVNGSAVQGLWMQGVALISKSNAMKSNGKE